MSPIDEVRHRRAVVIGTGVAGLSTALALGEASVLTKGCLGGSGSTPWSQGGIAAAVGPGDSAELHAADTVAVSGGIGDEAVAALVTGEAADRIRWLVALGARLDRNDRGELALGREAGHSRRRIVHAGGDATGAEVARSLAAATRAAPGIEVAEDSFAIDLLRAGDRVVGVLAAEGGDLVAYLAPAVVIATGGIGQAYSRTTNPVEVTGDGLAMAARAGAALADLEFVQFHPTALDADLDPLPLLTEALRGEGAVLIDGDGERFMPSEHPDAELAPRDVVARAIWARIEDGAAVFLDASRAIGAAFPDRFPTVFAAARDAGLDPRHEPLPVTPAAHYHMGGVAVDDAGRSSLPGLWACGEASSTGVHGANRLASNSLLEGLVFGVVVADSIDAAGSSPAPDSVVAPDGAIGLATGSAGDAIDAARRLMWRDVGLIRTGAGLVAALEELNELAPVLSADRDGRNQLAVARSVAAAALAREESRGGHYRADHPSPRPSLAQRTRVTPAAAPSLGLRLPVRAASAA